MGIDASVAKYLSPLLTSLILASGLIVSPAQSFLQNPDERARIEQALPAKAVVQPLKPRRLLIFTLNVGYGGHPSIAYANEAFTLMGKKTGAFETTVSNDPAVFQRDSFKLADADREPDPAATTEESSVVQTEGNREVRRRVTLYTHRRRL
ncbi:MAG TPA: hypothetical protein VI136_10865 [Verrucomicrobiae bacterium]